MTYANAITMIDELPPIVQVNHPSSGYPYSISHMPQSGQTSILPNGGGSSGSSEPNYYNEVIEKIPSIGRKIRSDDMKLHPFGRYDEVNDFLRKDNMPGVASQNYLSGNMIPKEEVNHLPIAVNEPVRYRNSQSKQIYPTMEYFDSIPCKDIANHIDNCPICSKIYRKNDYILIGIIIALIIVIVLLIIKEKK